MDRFVKNIKHLLLIVLVLAFCARVARCFLGNRIDKDSVIYLHMAEEMGRGHFNRAFDWNFRMPPLYLFMMALGEWLGVGAHLAGVAISVVAGTLLVLPAYSLGRALFDEKIGVAAAFLAATHPYLIRISADVMRDSLFITLIVGSLALAVAAVESKRALLWYFAGFLAGLAAMIRSEWVEMVLVVLIWVVIDVWIHRHSGWRVWRDAIMNVARFVVMAMAVAVPVQLSLMDTRSTWTVVDPRASIFVEDFFTAPAADVVEKEGK